jgi:acyl-CoA thioester hydrolase
MTPTSGAFEGQDHLYPVRVYYEDTDFSGYVYHGAYVKFFERGRSEALRLAGISHSDLLALDPPAAMVVRRMELDYLRPAVIDDALVVRSVMQSARGARMIIVQQIERGAEVLAKAQLEIALINIGGGPRKLPAEAAAKLNPLLKPGLP